MACRGATLSRVYPRRHRHTEQFVDLAEITNGFHVTTVLSKNESVFHRADSQEPLSVGRKWSQSVRRLP